MNRCRLGRFVKCFICMILNWYMGQKSPPPPPPPPPPPSWFLHLYLEQFHKREGVRITEGDKMTILALPAFTYLGTGHHPGAGMMLTTQNQSIARGG